MRRFGVRYWFLLFLLFLVPILTSCVTPMGAIKACGNPGVENQMVRLTILGPDGKETKIEQPLPPCED